MTTSVTKAEEILQRALDYHGGKFYSNLESLQYDKEYTLFHSDGSIEKSVTETHSYNYRSNTINIISIDKRDTTESNYSQEKYQRSINRIPQANEEHKIKKGMNASTFVLGIPFVLTYDKELIKFEEQLETGEDVISIQYNSSDNTNHSSSELWKFNINQQGRVISNLIFSKDHISLVENSSSQKVGNILWYKNRKSFRVDSLGNKLYLRAEYLYKDFKPKFKS